MTLSKRPLQKLIYACVHNHKVPDLTEAKIALKKSQAGWDYFYRKNPINPQLILLEKELKVEVTREDTHKKVFFYWSDH